MPDHLHLLVELGDKEPLSRVMQRLKSVVSTALQRTLGKQEIWQSGYHDHALRQVESIRDASRYILANPIRAGLVDDVGQYPFWDAIWLEPGTHPLL
jgi:REP element-mobilizing transposase RayT